MNVLSQKLFFAESLHNNKSEKGGRIMKELLAQRSKQQVKSKIQQVECNSQ